MPGSHTSDQPHIPPSHQDFRWIHGPGQHERFAELIELTRDVTAGVRSCLQVVYASDLAREINQEQDLGQRSAPAIGKTDAANFFRLSLAATSMLCNVVELHIADLNKARED